MLKFGKNKCQTLLFQAFFSEFDYVDSFRIYAVIKCYSRVGSYCTLVMWVVFSINGYQVSKEKSSEFLANLGKNLANSSDFLGAN